MIQSQLGNADFNSLLDLDGQVQALKLELEEVKQADDEEIDRLLDQNGTACFAVVSSASVCPVLSSSSWSDLYFQGSTSGPADHAQQVDVSLKLLLAAELQLAVLGAHATQEQAQQVSLPDAFVNALVAA